MAARRKLIPSHTKEVFKQANTQANQEVALKLERDLNMLFRKASAEQREAIKTVIHMYKEKSGKFSPTKTIQG